MNDATPFSLLSPPSCWTVTAFVLVSATARAQEPVVADRVDEFTNARVLTVQMSDTTSGPICTWTSTDGQCQLVVRWPRPGRVPGVILTGDVLLLKLEDGRVVTLHSATVATGEHYLDRKGGVVTATTAAYPITPADLAQLAGTWVVKIRICYYDDCPEWSSTEVPMWQYSFARSASTFKDMRPFDVPPAPEPRSPIVVER